MQRLTAQLDRYATSRQQVDLYLHVDKSVYLHNENIWFTAYVLNSLPGTVEQNTLYVLLVEESSKKIVASDRFVLDHGLGGGSLFLPDSLPGSLYRLLAYTNTYSTHQDHFVFQQAITLKTADPPLFKLAKVAPSKVDIEPPLPTPKVNSVDDRLASGGPFLNTNTEEVRSNGDYDKNYSFGEATAVAKDVQAGKPASLPAIVAGQGEQPVIRHVVPQRNDSAYVYLYPEGGALVNNSKSYIGVEIKNANNEPLATGGQLLEDDQPVSSFITDRLGTGIIAFTPLYGKTYTLKLDDAYAGVAYKFPKIEPAGFSVHVGNAVVKNNTISVEIGGASGDTCHLLAHNYRTVFYAASVVLPNKPASLRLSAADMPEGVVTLTLFTKDGVPKAERAVYIQRSEPLRIAISVDSTTYHHRSKVQLNVKVTNSKGQPVQSFFSLACVMASRLDSTRAMDIVRFNQFDRFLPGMSAMPGGRWFDEAEQIERVLLTRYWTKYKWESDINTAKQGLVVTALSNDTGIVYFNRQPVKKPVRMALMSGRNSQTFVTDATGRFELPYDLLKVDPGQKVTLLLCGSTNKSKNYEVEIHPGNENIDTRLSRADYPAANYIPAELSYLEQQLLKKAMPAVFVTAKKKDDLEAIPFFRSVTCRDWVCMNNILNCNNHPIGYAPVTGARYNYNNGFPVRYMGCELNGPGEAGSFVKLVNGISYPKEFYVADYTKFNPAAPEVLSTLFWSYKTITNEKGEASLQFSTNDLDGRFTCVLQGYSDEGPLSARTSFRVIE
ncbi:hypothetical protein D3H65_12565 [Paraflavitalea soli]|uniref:Macroglobulin domain-containing protein n=1 Tax=Paraflavitalea soli TaxID=2315862 RepID=A0A3B7MT00_9BACT|nr:hypothetical protein D3H65_12565 [Paraflavitalea soli]